MRYIVVTTLSFNNGIKIQYKTKALSSMSHCKFKTTLISKSSEPRYLFILFYVFRLAAIQAECLKISQELKHVHTGHV